MQLKATDWKSTYSYIAIFIFTLKKKKKKRHLYGNIILFVDLLLRYPPSAKAIESNKKCM